MYTDSLFWSLLAFASAVYGFNDFLELSGQLEEHYLATYGEEQTAFRRLYSYTILLVLEPFLWLALALFVKSKMV